MALHTASETRRQVLQRRIRIIVAVTIGYNMIEAIIAITAGTAASSAALIGFGLDSTIEVLSAAAVAWQFTRRDPERWEKPTLRVIAVAFFTLAAYVTATSVAALVAGVHVQHSTVGIVLTAVSVVVMPFLSYAERRAGREVGSASAVADSKQTLVCTYLSAAVLVGLVVNSTLGWSGCGLDRRLGDRGVRGARGGRGVEGRRLRDLGRHDLGRRPQSNRPLEALTRRAPGTALVRPCRPVRGGSRVRHPAQGGTTVLMTYRQPVPTATPAATSTGFAGDRRTGRWRRGGGWVAPSSGSSGSSGSLSE